MRGFLTRFRHAACRRLARFAGLRPKVWLRSVFYGWIQLLGMLPPMNCWAKSNAWASVRIVGASQVIVHPSPGRRASTVPSGLCTTMWWTLRPVSRCPSVRVGFVAAVHNPGGVVGSSVACLVFPRPKLQVTPLFRGDRGRVHGGGIKPMV